MGKYLYNGVELPALPEWDKTTYPYAILYLTSGGLYMFSVCNKPFSYGTIEGFSFVGVWAEYNNAYKIYRVSEDLTQFELLNENENNGGYYSPCKTSEGDTLIWANTDILNEDGTVYLAASEPLPVVTGKWLFNETIKVIDTIDKMFNGSEISSFVSNHTEFNSIRVRTFFENMTQHNYLQYYTQGVEEYTKVYDYKSKTWLDEAYRTIDYGDKRFGATVEFYAWLTENAVPVGGEPEHPEEPETVLAWKKHDAYKPNTKWDGNTFYKVMGGQWVKQNAMSSTEKPAPIPTNCLTFSSAEPFTIAVNNATKNWDGALYYSTDTTTWSEWTGVTSITSATHGREQRIYLRGSGNTKITGIYSNTNQWVLTGANVSCHGNIENLLDYEMVSNGVHPPMADACYHSLFSSWSGLIKAPDLGAIIMTPSCYRNMFDSCTNLVTSPELPATTLEDRCYYSMFRSCINLKVAPRLPATNLYIGCYLYMFTNCIGLTIPPELPAENLEERCYSSMFSNCTGLVALPKLKATNLKFRCYAAMFRGCTSIKLSEMQTGEYQTPYRIPTSGTGVMEDNALEYMFERTSGTFVGEADIESAGTPKINKTYYTSNTVV